MGGEEQEAFLVGTICSNWQNRNVLQARLARGFPLTPRPPTPQKFGVSLIKLFMGRDAMERRARSRHTSGLVLKQNQEH